MSEILEAVMLICFGCSWPMSLIKNIKSKTAKGMSLPFIVLIVVGYLAGITAKLLTGSCGCILLVYILNLVVVSANLAVYFVNLRRDRAKDETAAYRCGQSHTDICRPAIRLCRAGSARCRHSRPVPSIPR